MSILGNFDKNDKNECNQLNICFCVVLVPFGTQKLKWIAIKVEKLWLLPLKNAKLFKNLIKV